MADASQNAPQEGEIPQSNALAEASPDSLAELLSRDPFKFTSQDRGRIVAALRDQRAKWEAAEKAEGFKPKATKAPAGKAASLVAKATSGDLGL